MADIFREVEEELRRDRAEELWKKYGRYVIALAALVILAVGGVQGWRAYDAVCTPDFFGFNKDLELQYRGRLDESKTTPVEGARRELFEAMVAVAETGEGPRDQIASMGCSIKWRAA